MDRETKTEPTFEGGDAAHQKLSRLLFEKPTELFAVLTAIPTLFYGLGLLTHHSREELIRLGLPLSYPHQSAILVSLHVLWSLPWNTLTALFVGGGIALVAWFLALLALASFALERLDERRWIRWSLPVWMALVWLALFLVVGHYRPALYPRHAPDGYGSSFLDDMGPRVVARVETETIAWLRNDSERNRLRRAGLAGLYGWILLTLASYLWILARRRTLWPPLRRLYLAAYALLAALVVSELPRAHVIANWGVSYPTVRVLASEACDAQLHTAIAAGRCCAYDVSTSGTPRVTLLLGEACPNGEGFRTWAPEESHCLLTGATKVIDGKDC